MTRPFEGRSAEDLEGVEDALLEDYAVRSRGATRRHALQDTGRTLSYRTPFQRDRDRILHSLAFRRLKHKTQVYVPYEGDHHRTRLTHTLEVAQVARTVARALGLNEDLAEAISLGHDLGQPPFGRGGQEVLEDLLSGAEPVEGIDTDVLSATGGFRPNYQGLRVVDQLEQRYAHPGLNLTDPVREGIWKCGPVEPTLDYPDWRSGGLAPEEPPFLEAQVVAAGDRIARLAHDLEDGMRCREVDLEAVERLAVGRAVLKKLGGSYPQGGNRLRRQNAMTRGILHLLVSDVVVHSAARLRELAGDGSGDGTATEEDDRDSRTAPTGAEDAAPEAGAATSRPAQTDHDRSGDGATAPSVPRLPAGTVGFSTAVGKMVDELDSFVEGQVYRSFAVSRLDARARTFIVGLLSAYYKDPLQLDDYALFRYRGRVGGPYLRDVPGNRVEEEIRERYRGKPAFVRLLADHIAGMSDTYALKEYERLYLPFPEAEGR